METQPHVVRLRDFSPEIAQRILDDERNVVITVRGRFVAMAYPATNHFNAFLKAHQLAVYQRCEAPLEIRDYTPAEFAANTQQLMSDLLKYRDDIVVIDYSEDGSVGIIALKPGVEGVLIGELITAQIVEDGASALTTLVDARELLAQLGNSEE